MGTKHFGVRLGKKMGVGEGLVQTAEGTGGLLAASDPQDPTLP